MIRFTFSASIYRRVVVYPHRKRVRCQNGTYRRRVLKYRMCRAIAAVTYRRHRHSSHHNRKPVGSNHSNGSPATRTNQPMRSQKHRQMCVGRTQPSIDRCQRRSSVHSPHRRFPDGQRPIYVSSVTPIWKAYRRRRPQPVVRASHYMPIIRKVHKT